MNAPFADLQHTLNLQNIICPPTDYYTNITPIKYINIYCSMNFSFIVFLCRNFLLIDFVFTHEMSIFCNLFLICLLYLCNLFFINLTYFKIWFLKILSFYIAFSKLISFTSRKKWRISFSGKYCSILQFISFLLHVHNDSFNFNKSITFYQVSIFY